MTKQHTCERCNAYITQNEAGNWEDQSGIMADWCRYGHPDEKNNPDIRHVPSVMSSTCTFCKREVTEVADGHWHTADPIFPQYCYADMVEGSRLHTPA